MRSWLIAACLAASIALPVTGAWAGEPTRTLNGHDFMPSKVVEGPFAVSYFASFTGGGQAFDVKTPFVNTDGETLGTLEGDVAFMTLGFKYQQRFGSWFAARAGFNGGARIGTEEQSILAQGVTGTYALTFGGIARILQTETVILSGALDFARTDLVGLDTFGFAQSVIDNGGLDPENNDLVSSSNVVNTRLSVLAGWAPYDWLGINGYLDGGTAETTGSSQEVLVGGAAAIGVDLENLDLIPIGLQLVARNNAFTTGGADLASRSWSWGLGFYYTGWHDFSIGLEATSNVFDRRGEGDDFESFVGSFSLRYWP